MEGEYRLIFILSKIAQWDDRIISATLDWKTARRHKNNRL
jgi:hypothetical protein